MSPMRIARDDARFAYAWFKIGNADIGVYSLHLKSNLVHGNNEIETAKNIRKREVSIQQLLVHIHDVIGTVIPFDYWR